MPGMVDCGYMAAREKRSENIAFGLRLKAARENARDGKGYSQAQVASWFGITNKAISQYEAGGAEFQSRYLSTLARKLDVPIGFFFDIEDEFHQASNEDVEWLGYMGRRISMMPPGRLREQYKERLRALADVEYEFLKRLSEEGLG